MRDADKAMQEIIIFEMLKFDVLTTVSWGYLVFFLFFSNFQSQGHFICLWTWTRKWCMLRMTHVLFNLILLCLMYSP